jgi:hypothetical protein
VELCKCFICTEKNGYNEDGTPVGDRILRSQMLDHHAVCNATILERQAFEAAAETYKAEIANEFFLSTLRDDDAQRERPQSNPPPNTPRNLPTPAPSPSKSARPLIRPSTPTGSAFPSLASLASALPTISNEPGTIGDPCNVSIRRVARRERNRATLKAHVALDSVQRRVSELSESLASIPAPHHLLTRMEEMFKDARERFELVRRSTPTLDTRKVELAEKLLELEKRIASLRVSTPISSLEPRVCDTGKSLKTAEHNDTHG